MTLRWARRRRAVSWLASAVALLAAGRLAGLRLNLTESLPVGLYVAVGEAPVRGALVLLCLPPEVAAFAKTRGYVPRGGACPGGIVPIGKSIVAMPGDTVTVTPAGMLVNGKPVPGSQTLTADRRGRPLPQLDAGRYIVDPGQLWCLSSYSRFSFDSRYFGAVHVGQVRATLRPLWTAG